MSSLAAPRFPMRSYWAVLAALATIVAIPLLLSLGADWLLQVNGCVFDLKNGTTCMIGETDWGPVLGRTFLWSRAAAAVAIWIAVAVVPIWFVVLLLHRSRWKRGTGVAA